MSQAVQWKRGEFLTFNARMKIRVGGTNPIDILAGDQFEYDGTIVKYAGAEFPQPGVRGAINEGWATLDIEKGVPAPFSAERKMAKAQTVNRDLNNVQRMESKILDQTDADEDVVLNLNDRKEAMDTSNGKGHITEKNNRRKTASGRVIDVKQSDFDEQDGKTVSRVKSPAKLAVDVTANPGAAQDINNISHEQGYGRSERIGQRVTMTEGITMTTNSPKISPVAIGDENDGTTVAKVRHSTTSGSKEGVSVTDTSGIRNKSDDSISPKLRIAIKVYPNFPHDWNFFGKTEEKLEKMKKIGTNPDFIDALYASESNSMKKALEQAFPKHFSK